MNRGIDLTIKKQFEERPFPQKLLMWSSSAGRVVVIVTQITVFSAFAYRFYLDRQVVNLTDNIRQKAASLETSSKFEQEFKEAQNKLAGIKLIANSKTIPPALPREFVKTIPADITPTQIKVEINSIGLSGETDQPQHIAQLVQNLKKSKRYRQIMLTANSYYAKDKSYKFSLQIIPI